MTQQNSKTRRGFLKSAAVTGAVIGAPMIIPASARGADGKVAPSNRITMGGIGVGSMGSGDLRGFLNFPQVQVLAVCDVDTRNSAKAKKSVDAKYKNADCAVYGDFRELIGRGDLDACFTALPDHWHAIPAIEAARAGLDIHGQKPLARSIREGRAMANAVHRYGRVWQTGSQQRSDARFRLACELVRNGRVGKVEHIEVGLGKSKINANKPITPPPAELDYEFWLGPAPARPHRDFGRGGTVHWNWRWMMDYSGGQLTDWAGHHIDIAQWAMGFEKSGPVAIEGKGTFDGNGMSDVPIGFDFTMTYKTGLKISVADHHTKGITFYGSDAKLYVTRGKITCDKTGVLTEPIGADEIHVYKSNNHKGNFLECVKSRRETVAPIEIGLRSISAGLLGEIAMLTGRKIHWNPDTEEITGDPGASALLGRAYREPWVL